MTEGLSAATQALWAASWGWRFAAWFLDVMIAFGGPLVVAGIVLPAAGASDETEESIAFVVAFGSLVLMPIYFALFHAGPRGQTIGKRATRIAVRDAVTGGRLSYGRSFGRAYLMFVLYVAGGVGFVVDCLWPLWDKRKQALHDKAVSSIVVRERGSLVAESSPF